MSSKSPGAAQHVVRAIPTRYKGYHFRSRLEARWAVFFDKCDIGLDWQYELEGFDLPSGRYLPDFLLWGGMWIEIKPQRMSSDDFDTAVLKLTELGDATGKSCALLVGDPVDFIGGEETVARGYVRPTDFKPVFAYIPHTFDGDTTLLGLMGILSYADKYGSDPVAAAVAAREARFEFGAKP